MRVVHGMRPPEKYAPMLTVLLALQFGAERPSILLVRSSAFHGSEPKGKLAV